MEAISDLPRLWRALTGRVGIETIPIAVDNLEVRVLSEPICHFNGHAICQDIDHKATF